MALIGADGREKLVSRDLILVRHSERNIDPSNLSAALAEMEGERSRLAGELDLKLLWEVVKDQGGSFTAEELAELFFGQRSAIGTTVVLDALLNDRLYFIRRHLEFVPNPPERVDRIRVQQERTRLRSDESRRTQTLMRDVLNNVTLDPGQVEPLAEQLRKYLDNPSTRSNELTALLTAVAPDLAPAETAYEILERTRSTVARATLCADWRDSHTIQRRGYGRSGRRQSSGPSARRFAFFVQRGRRGNGRNRRRFEL